MNKDQDASTCKAACHQSPTNKRSKMFKHPGKLWMGEGTHQVPMELFATNRRRLVERLRAVNAPKGSVVFLQGGSDIPVNDTDFNHMFRQESYFMWSFGVLEPDCFGAIEVDSGKTNLFVPHLPESYAIWMGPLHTLDDFSRKYVIENVYYSDTIADVLKRLAPSLLLLLKGVNSDSGLAAKEVHFKGIESFTLDDKILYNVISELRVIKTKLELEVMQYVIEISSAAHRKVMRMAKAGKSEYQCESEFLHYCYNVGGCRNVSYTCICGSGPNGAILHYGHAGSPNDRFIKRGDLCLFDMGANYFGYAADITCTFPVNGKFSPDQKLIYNAVLDANLAVAMDAKPGVNWVDMHILANRVLLTKLKEGGLLRGNVDDMMEIGLGHTFQPHGLGHLLGLDVHDVGGYLPDHPTRRQTPVGVNRLRTARDLLENMVLTIEPGCYFVDPLLDEASRDPKMSKFLVPDVIKRFRGFGGVRIEDDIVVTATGVKNLTKVPRTVQEVEDWIAGKDNTKY